MILMLPGAILGIMLGWIWGSLYDVNKSRFQPDVAIFGTLLCLAVTYLVADAIEIFLIFKYKNADSTIAQHITQWLSGSLFFSLFPDVMIAAIITSRIFRKRKEMKQLRRIARNNALRNKLAKMDEVDIGAADFSVSGGTNDD